MAEHAQIVRVAKYRPQPGGAEDLRSALHALADGMRGLPGLFGAQVCRLHEDPEWIALVSRWDDEQSMQSTGEAGIEGLVERVGGLAEEQQIEHLIVE